MTTLELTKNQKSPHVLEGEIWVPQPIETVFAFFSEAQNLQAITPPHMNFKIKTPDIEMRPHARIEYALSLRGIPFKWRSLITVWEPPYRFVDLQTHGPYQLWEHVHSFEPADGGTWVRDRVRFQFVGSQFLFPFVAHDIKSIFKYRQKEIERRFG